MGKQKNIKEIKSIIDNGFYISIVNDPTINWDDTSKESLINYFKKQKLSEKTISKYWINDEAMDSIFGEGQWLDFERAECIFGISVWNRLNLYNMKLSPNSSSIIEFPLTAIINIDTKCQRI